MHVQHARVLLTDCNELKQQTKINAYSQRLIVMKIEHKQQQQQHTLATMR